MGVGGVEVWGSGLKPDGGEGAEERGRNVLETLEGLEDTEDADDAEEAQDPKHPQRG